jgi:ATP-dependent Clp protease adapter protein ClpS
MYVTRGVFRLQLVALVALHSVTALLSPTFFLQSRSRSTSHVALQPEQHRQRCDNDGRGLFRSARTRWAMTMREDPHMMPVPDKSGGGRQGRSSRNKPKIGQGGGSRVGKPGGGGDPAGGGAEMEKQQGGAGVATITIERVDETTETEFKEELDKEGWWRVLLHNDEIHTFEYVTEAIVKVVPQITRKKAFTIARTVHMNGVGTITTVWKQLAEQLCMGLQTFGLTVSIAPDSKFNDNNEGGEEG